MPTVHAIPNRRPSRPTGVVEGPIADQPGEAVVEMLIGSSISRRKRPSGGSG